MKPQNELLSSRISIINHNINDLKNELETAKKKVPTGPPVNETKSPGSLSAKVDALVRNIKFKEEQIKILNNLSSQLSECGVTDLLSSITTIGIRLCEFGQQIDNNIERQMELVSTLLKVEPNILCDIAKLMHFDLSEETKAILDHKSLWNPPEIKQGIFGMSTVLGQVINPKQRYLVNMPSKQLVEILSSYSSYEMDLQLNAKMFINLGSQTRFLTLWQEIASSLFYSDNVTEADALQNTNHENLRTKPRKWFELVSVQAIMYLLSRFENLPFYELSSGRMAVERDGNVSWGTCLLQLLYSLLELSKEEKGHNITRELAENIIQYRAYAAQSSFETVHLDNKDTYNTAYQTIVSNLGKSVKISIEQTGMISAAHVVSEDQEIYMSQESKADIRNNVKIENMYPSIKSYLIKHLSNLQTADPWKNSEHARHLISSMLIAGNCAIYLKTFLVIEAEKSVQPTVRAPIEFPKPEKYAMIDGTLVPVQFDWNTGDPIFGELRKIYIEALDNCKHTFNTDLEMYFVQLLTNRSQGEKASLQSYQLSVSESDTDQRSKLLYSVAQARIAAFLLERSKYYNVEEFTKSLTKQQLCTARYQIERRARFVEIVNNFAQISTALLLKLFETRKVNDEIMAVGKQVGGVYDALSQLSSTGNINGASISSDVKGMDTSTLTSIGIMYAQILSEYFQHNKIGPDSYFAFKQRECEFLSSENNIPIPVDWDAVSQCLNKYIMSKQQTSYLYKDPSGGPNVLVNPAIFESGRFDTGAQHTTLLADIAKIKKQVLRQQHGGVLPYTLHSKKFGDDSFEAITTTTRSKLEEYSEQVADMEAKLLIKLGYEIDPIISYYVGDFLQMMAFNGRYVPKSARSSIYVDERSTGRNRDVMAMYKIMSEVTATVSQRLYSPENGNTIFWGIWLFLRISRIPKSDISIENTKWYNLVRNLETRQFFIFPFIMPALPPVNHPMSFYYISNEVQLRPTSILFTVGDVGYVRLWNDIVPDAIRLVSTNIYLQAFPDSTKVANTHILDTGKVFLDYLKKGGLLDALVLTTYNRANLLSRDRHATLKADIDIMSSGLSAYYNSAKLQSSYSAWTELKLAYGLEVPKSISHWAQPMVKIENMFASVTENPTETVSMNNAFLLFLKNTSKKNPTEILKKLDSLAINISLESIDDPYYVETYNQFPMIPGARKLSASDEFKMRAGTPFILHGRVSKLESLLGQKYGEKFDIQTAFTFGMAALNKSEDAFNLFIINLALNDTEKIEFRQLMLEMNTQLGDRTYNTGFRPSVMFDLSGDLSYISKFIDVVGTYSERAKRVCTLIGRDMLMTLVHKIGANKLLVTPSEFSKIRIDARRVAESLGVNYIEM